jgi:hypothetical protein
LEFAERSKAPWVIGALPASDGLSEDDLQKLLRDALGPILAGEGKVHSYKNLIEGAMHALAPDDRREAALTRVAAGLSEQEMVHLIVLAPFGKLEARRRPPRASPGRVLERGDTRIDL